MSMRDFITRVLNTRLPVVAETTPRIVAEDHSPIVVETPHSSWWRTTSTCPRERAAPKTACRSIGISRAAAPQCWEAENMASAPAPTPNIPRPRSSASATPAATARSRPGSRGQPIPEAVLAAAADPSCPWVAHNAAFERAVLECILIPRHGWPMVPVDRHVCTMALALAHAYPGSLDGVAKILGLVNQKDVAREKIVRVMWKPRKPRRGEDPTKIYWVDSPELRTELYIYNQAGRRGRTRAASASRAAGAAGVGAGYVGARRRDQRSRSTASTRRWPRQRPGSRRRRSPT